MVIYPNDYITLLSNLYEKIDFEFDAIIAIKRSGWIMGSIYSNLSNKPLYTNSEINSIPEKFSRILIVDDKIHKGKTIKKVTTKLIKKNKVFKTASIFIEGNVFSDYYEIKVTNKKIKPWYETEINYLPHKNMDNS